MYIVLLDIPYEGYHPVDADGQMIGEEGTVPVFHQRRTAQRVADKITDRGALSNTGVIFRAKLTTAKEV